MPKNIEQLKQFLTQAKRIVFFTGAGFSTESGITDYRSKGGLWQRFQPVTIQEFLEDEDKRKLYWQHKKELYGQIQKAKPHAGYYHITNLEKAGRLAGVITQNIDGLHKVAGTKNVYEIHGTNREVICLHCGEISPFDPIYDRLLKGEEIPLCEKCEGLLKPNTISFGQMLDPNVLRGSIDLARTSDLIVACGSTLIVEPAASLPRYGIERGAKFVIINREPTPLDNEAAVVILGDCSATMENVFSN